MDKKHLILILCEAESLDFMVFQEIVGPTIQVSISLTEKQERLDKIPE